MGDIPPNQQIHKHEHLAYEEFKLALRLQIVNLCKSAVLGALILNYNFGIFKNIITLHTF